MEGEMEKLEVEGSFSVAEGGSTDPKRKADHSSARTVLTKEESEGVKGAENERQGMEVDDVIPETQPSSNETHGVFFMCQVEEQQAARVEVQGPKRRVTRVESAETQDFVRERVAHEEINQEEADEMGFVPSALSELRGAFYWCDNRCSDEALRFLQIASMVIEEGGEARTTNLRKRCCNQKLVQQGKQSLKSMEWSGVVERKAHRGRLWKIFGIEQFLRGMREYSILKRAGARKVLADAAQEKQERIQGQWQQESPFKEVLQHVERNADTDCNAQIMRRAHIQCKEVGQLGKLQRGIQESSVNGPLRGFKRPMTRLPRRTSAA